MEIISIFQDKVRAWMHACFGPAASNDKIERNHRFFEKAVELVQACGCSKEDCLKLVEHIYAKPLGEPIQEVGGVIITLAALCCAQGINLQVSAETELDRVWDKIDAIREKQKRKRELLGHSSPLPE